MSIRRDFCINPGIEAIIKTTADDFTVSGRRNIPKKGGLFISNHLNILFDASLVSHVLQENGMRHAHAAAGQNIYQVPLVSTFLRWSDCFAVPRYGAGKSAIVNLSHQIASLLEEGEHVWISQREGRAKDGNHKTEPKVLKMLKLAYKQKKYHAARTIIPVAVSYELIPDDLRMVRQRVSGHKGAIDDFLGSAVGIFGRKGRIHLAFGEPVEVREDIMLANDIDSSIAKNYRQWPTTTAAAALLKGWFAGTDRQVINYCSRIPKDPAHAKAFHELYAGPLRF